MTTKTNSATSKPEAAQGPMPAENRSANTTAKSSKSQAGAKPIATATHPVVDRAEWCLVVCENGEYPTLEIFPDIDAMTKRLRALEDKDATAIPFFGIPVPFTPGPYRFLRLPDGKPHPVVELSRYGKFVPDPQATLPIDVSYQLGPDMLGGTVSQSIVIDHRPAASEGQGGNG